MPKVTLSASGFDRVINSLQAYPKAAQQSLLRSINRTLPGSRERWQRDIREKVNLSAAAVKRRFHIKRANFNRKKGEIIVSRQAVGLIDYDAKQTQRGVTFRVIRGASRQRLEHAFIATMKSGHKGVFTRKGKERTPIRERYSSAVVEVAQDYLDDVQAVSEERFLSEFFHNLDFYLGKK